MRKLLKNTLIIIGIIFVSLVLLWFFYEKRTKGIEALINAADVSDIQRMETLVESGVNPDGIAYDGLTPIVVATQRHQYEAINYLMSVGVNINNGDENHLTPLFYAALQNDEPMYDFLIQKGAQLHFPDKLREKYLLNVVEASKNQQLYEKVQSQLAKEKSN